MKTKEKFSFILMLIMASLIVSTFGVEAHAMASTTQITYHHPDHLGGAHIDTNEKGEVINTIDYTPYGDTHVSTSTPEKSLRFLGASHQYTGQVHDEDTGLYYYNARYYHPKIGRFISQDPWEGNLADPQSLNKYSYVLNNPLKYIDPSGENPFLIYGGMVSLAYKQEGFAGVAEVLPVSSDISDIAAIITGKTLFTGTDVTIGEALAYAAIPVIGIKGGRMIVDEARGLVRGTKQLIGEFKGFKSNLSFGKSTKIRPPKNLGKKYGATGVVVGNQPGIFKEYTGYSQMRASTRGVLHKTVLSTLKNPKAVLYQGKGRNLYLSDQAGVVLENGKVITTYGKKDFKPHINRILDES